MLPAVLRGCLASSVGRVLDRAARAGPRGRLPPASKLILATEVLCVYPSMLVRMRRQGIREIIEGIRRSPRSDASVRVRSATEREMVARRLGGAVGQTLAVLPTDSRCLVQALVLTRLLSARSIPSRFIIGARPDPQFMAHAWVECDGIPVLPARGYSDARLLEL
jgi:hypothetical protein